MNFHLTTRFLIAFLFLSPIFLQAQQSVKFPKQIKKDFVPLESKQGVFVSKYETTNMEFRTFLADLAATDPVLYEQCMYDSSQWQEQFPMAYNEPMVRNYHWHPAFDEYPVVNVSWEAAQKYCDWLSAEYNRTKKEKHTRVSFRLPTEEEWRLATAVSDPEIEYPTPNGGLVENERYLANLNYTEAGDARYTVDGSLYTSPVDAYQPNKTGIYNLLGNVSEMSRLSAS